MPSLTFLSPMTGLPVGCGRSSSGIETRNVRRRARVPPTDRSRPLRCLATPDSYSLPLGPGDQIVLTDGERPVGRIVAAPSQHMPRRAGVCKGMLDILDDDERAILDRFRDYVP